MLLVLKRLRTRSIFGQSAYFDPKLKLHTQMSQSDKTKNCFWYEERNTDKTPLDYCITSLTLEGYMYLKCTGFNSIVYIADN